MKPQQEVRTRKIELRADDEKMQLVGYAAKFNVVSNKLGDFYEVIKRGAFDGVLAGGSDCFMLLNHDQNKVLGRRAAGTLELRSDATGLAFTCQLDRNQQGHRDIFAACRRKDLTEASFAFSVTPNSEQWSTMPDPENRNRTAALRTLKNIDRLYDISLVATPGYPQTVVSTRAEQRARIMAARRPLDPLNEPSNAALRERLAQQRCLIFRDHGKDGGHFRWRKVDPATNEGWPEVFEMCPAGAVGAFRWATPAEMEERKLRHKLEMQGNIIACDRILDGGPVPDEWLEGA